MSDDRIPQAQSDVLDPSGKRFTMPWFRFFAALDGVLARISDNLGLGLLKANNLSDVESAASAFTNIKQSASGSTTGVVQQTQTWEANFQVAKVTTSPIVPIFRTKKARIVTEIVTDCTSGTCTLTGTIGGVALGGGANSVSTTEQTKTHSSANTIAANGNLVLTPSSVSSCLNMVVSVKGTYSLDA